MQIIYRDKTERIWTEFKDADGVAIQPSGSITVSIQHQGASTPRIIDAVATHLEGGRYFYEVAADNDWLYGYYGAFWQASQSGLIFSQDVPNVFKIENPKESIIKGIMLERVRSQLYMHADMHGFVNKYPRDRELLDYLQTSLNWWNSHPPAITFHSFLDVPTPYYSIIEQGAVVNSLVALGVFEAGKHFIYNDNGISLTRDRSGKYQAIYGMLLTSYAQHLKAMRTKYALDHVNARGLFSSTTGFPRSLSRALRGVQKFA